MKPYLLVIKTAKLNECFDFYTAAGFNLEVSQHEGGPEHYSVNLDGLIFELYPSSPDSTSQLRLGFTIPENYPNKEKAIEFINQSASEKYDIGEGKNYCVVKDPDGRAIEFVFDS